MDDPCYTTETREYQGVFDDVVDGILPSRDRRLQTPCIPPRAGRAQQAQAVVDERLDARLVKAGAGSCRREEELSVERSRRTEGL